LPDQESHRGGSARGVREEGEEILGAARRAQGGFFVGFAFGNGQGKQLFTLAAKADFEIGTPFVVHFGREQKLYWIKTEDDPVSKFDQREPIVKYFKRRFLAFAIQEMPDYQYRLSFAFGSKISQSALRIRRTEILAAGAGSDRGHGSTSAER
jgi:hypothetical protein